MNITTVPFPRTLRKRVGVRGIKITKPIVLPPYRDLPAGGVAEVEIIT